MSDPKIIYLGPACQKEGDGREWCEDDVWTQCECGCSSVRYVLESDAQSELAETRRDGIAALENLEESKQRISVLTDALECLLAGTGSSPGATRKYAKARAALSSTEFSGTLQQRLAAAEQRNSDLIDLIQKAHTWVDRNNCGGWDAYELRDELAAAMNKPTESGGSE